MEQNIFTRNNLDESSFPAFKRCYEIAKTVHAGQKRSDGKDYMTHIDAVIENTMSGIYISSVVDCILCVAALHDAKEDHPDAFEWSDISDILDEYYSSDLVDYTIDALKAITKVGKKGEYSYTEYLKGVKDNNYSRRVKIADLRHNMSDLKPGNLYEKYELSLSYLEGKL